MLKLCGVVLVFGCCSAWGIGMHARLRRRVRILNGLCNAFAALRGEIVFLQTPLPQAIAKAADITGNVVFSNMAEQMQCAQTPIRAMQTALMAESSLTEADKDVLLYAANSLGGSDTAGQERHIHTVLKQLEVQKKHAGEAYDASGRLYLAGGLLGGVLLVILLT